MTTPFFKADHQAVQLPDGRIISFGVYGAGRDKQPGATPHPVVFYLHGVPSSHHEAFAMHDAAVARGLQLVALNRPGYAHSTPQPGRTFLDWPKDLLAVADHFSVDRFAVVGASGGGPYALACLHSIPKERLAGVAVLCGVYPKAFGLEGMKFLNWLLFTITPWVPWLISAIVYYTQTLPARDVAHPERFDNKNLEMFKTLPPADRVILEENRHGYRDAILACAREALIPGGSTFALEFCLLAGDWGYEFGELAEKAQGGRLVLWHGTEDINVPFAMAEKAEKLLPGVELRRLEGEGHIGPVMHADEVLDVVKGMLDRAVD